MSTSTHQNASMTLRKWTAASVGGAVLVVGLNSLANAADCSPVDGQWYFQGKPGPVIAQSGDRLSIDMSAYGRPTATGRLLSPTEIQVRFSDDENFTGSLDGRGVIRWSNGTVWDARNFSGSWQFAGKSGAMITQTGGQLRVDMAAYNRPVASGSITGSFSVASVTFPDDATHTATLVSPNCIQWSNGTTWTK